TGLNHTCALMTTGGVKCWGAGDGGQLGSGSTASQPTPTDVNGLTSGVAAISTGRSHTCAVLTSGSMACWGQDASGQLGDATFGAGTCHCNLQPLLVVEATSKPTPTFTPCPTGGCPTATPTPTPNSYGINFTINSDIAGGAANSCNTLLGSPADCYVPLGGTFSVSVYLRSLPTAPSFYGYEGFQFTLEYSAVTAIENKQAVHPFYWPNCSLVGLVFNPGVEQVGCAIGIGAAPSTYTGRMAAPEFTCTSEGAITLMHGVSLTSIVDHNLFEFTEAGGNDSLNIHCVPPLAYPGDTDGDGCPDIREMGMNQMMGGRRNFVNPWDWFDPTGDHMTTISDPLAVADHYGRNYLDTGYDAKYDRTYIGPNPWNLGPPNGQIRIDDVLTSLHQYGAGCAAS
ncbi:MAG: flexitail domain-containing putative surface protein, partial [Mycobacterium sp.]